MVVPDLVLARPPGACRLSVLAAGGAGALASPRMERPASPIKVPVGEVVIAAYRSVFGRFGLVLELGWLPLLLMLAAWLLADLAPRYLAPWTETPPAAPPFDLGAPIEAVAGVLCLTAFSLRWHLLMLLGDAYALPRRVVAWAWLRFIGYTALVCAAGTALFFATGLTGAEADGPGTLARRVAAALLATALCLVTARLALLFPAAARGMPLGLGEAWRAMRGNGWRLAGATLMAVAPIVLVTVVLVAQLLSAARLGPAEDLVADPPLGLVLLNDVVVAVLGFVLTALAASILSDFYRRVVLQ